MSAPRFCGRMTLKALLESPHLQHPPSSYTNGFGLKDKKDGAATDIDFSSAFLGPQLWDKTYDASHFSLEYMNLDEFLSENGSPEVDEVGLADHLPTIPSTTTDLSTAQQRDPCQSPAAELQVSSHSLHSSINLNSSPLDPSLMTVTSAAKMTATSDQLSTLKREKTEMSSAAAKMAATSDQLSTLKREKSAAAAVEEVQADSADEVPAYTPSTSPQPLTLPFNLISKQDIALASIPGQLNFDPCSRNFSEEELKPQPVMKKSRKVFVPDEMKDDRYWQRRRKNNYAAKRSRDARRIKENQIAMRAAYLEKITTLMKEELEKVRCENAKLKLRLTKYESATPT